MTTSLTPERYAHICEIVDRALEHQPDSREEFVIDACQGDSALQEEVSRMLEQALHAADESFLRGTGPVSFRDENVAPADTLIGAKLGPYVIQNRIASGGMGNVYRASRFDDYREHVAIKVIKLGMDSEEMMRRFRTERQLLAELRHPNIASLLDGGTTPDGRPFFVMEYVFGTDIVSFADQQKLDVDERLHLFCSVLDAVQHAHDRNVLHRDLKPSNLLVTTNQNVKLVDFGIAKITAEADLLGFSARTRTVDRALTPNYASPEQWRGDSLTYASDVYGLGVVLFELLTGHQPFDHQGRSFREVEKAICEMPAPRPSEIIAKEVKWLATDGAERALGPDEINRLRESSRVGLRRRLRGDLDTILLKALSKEPERRYPTAAQFAADINRHLSGQPVHARSDGPAYRLSKLARRHPIVIGVVTLIAIGMVAGLFLASTVVIGLALIGGLIGTSVGLQNARRSQELAERRFDDVRDLAIGVIFDFEQRLRPLAGSTELRVYVIQHGLRTLDRLYQGAHEQKDLLFELAVAYREAAIALGKPDFPSCGAFPEALAAAKRSATLVRHLLASESDDPHAHHLLICVESLTAEIESATGDARSALERQLELKDRLSTLMERYPQIEVFGRSYFSGCLFASKLHLELGDYDAAMRESQAALGIAERWLETQPHNPSAIHDSCHAMQASAGTHVACREFDIARTMLEEAMKLADRLLKSKFESIEDTRLIAKLHLSMLDTHRASGDLKDFKSEMAHVIDAYRNVVAADPVSVHDRFALATALHEMALIEQAQGNHSEAIEKFNDSLQTIEDFSGSLLKGLLAPLATNYLAISKSQMALGDEQSAHNSLRCHIEFGVRLLSIDPHSPHAAMGLVIAWQHLAMHLRQSSRRDEETESWNESLRVAHEFFDAHPEDESWVFYICDLRLKRDTSLILAGETGESIFSDAVDAFNVGQAYLNQNERDSPEKSLQLHSGIVTVTSTAAFCTQDGQSERLILAQQYCLEAIEAAHRILKEDVDNPSIRELCDRSLSAWQTGLAQIEQALNRATG